MELAEQLNPRTIYFTFLMMNNEWFIIGLKIGNKLRNI